MPTSFSMLSPTSPGPLLSPITPVGGIVIDLFGASGGRIEAQLGPGELFSGVFGSGTPVLLGTRSGFTPSVLDTLGGGLSAISVRVTMNSGGTGPGDAGRNQDVLLVNGASMGDFSSVTTQQTSPDGQSGLSMNTSGGFRSDSLDTGFFYSTDGGLLSQIYASIERTGRVIYGLQSTARSESSVDFVGGLSRDLQNASRIPILAINPPIITDVKVGSPINEGAAATIVVTAFNLHHPASGQNLTYQFDPNNDGTFPISNTTGAASLSFGHPGTYVVPIRVYNPEGARADAQAVIVVRNVAPTVTSPGDQTAVEGATARLDLGSFTDPGRDSPWTVVVDWGDGSSPQTFNVAHAGDLGTLDHLYVRPGAYAVGVHVTDAVGLSADASFTTAVANVAPTVTSPGDQTAVEGVAADLRLGAFTDPGRDDPWLVHVSWGDGSAIQTFSVDQTGDLGSLSHLYAQAGTYSVAVSVVDLNGLGLSGAAWFQVVAQSVAPTLASPGDQKAVEGQSTPIALGSFSDASRNASWTVQVDWGDDSAAQTFTTSQPGLLNSLGHAFPRAGVFTVNVRVTAANGLADSVLFLVDVANIAPTVTSPGDQKAVEGTTASFALGSFTDPGQDTPWTFVVNWGDVAESQVYQTSRQGSLGNLTHTYAVPGRYAVSIQVADSGGLFNQATFGVDVANVAPTVTSPGDQVALEGSQATLALGRFTDPGADSPWTVHVTWSDGADEQAFTVDRPGDLGAVTRVFGVHGVYQATVEVTDALGMRGTSSFLVNVGDVAPIFDDVQFPATIDVNQSGLLLATFHDPGFLDRFHVSVDWGDQTSTDFGSGLTFRDYFATHAFARSGSYQVVVTVVDLAGASASARLSVLVNAPPIVATPTPAAHQAAPPVSQPLSSSLITALDFLSSSSSKGRGTSSAPPPKGLIPNFPGALGQGIGKNGSFSKMAGKTGANGGRSLEEILAILLSGRKAPIQVAAAARGAGVEVAGDLRALVATAGPKSPELAAAVGLVGPEALGSPLSRSKRARGKATRVMILVVAWTVSLRNQRGSSFTKRSGRFSPEKAKPAGQPS
ncbi:PKD domain-containing protein [Paludisphaera borealis]|uniref:PKD domain-containing protein n=1 Tax=Paludisphaera borealis TaxID=1387353 RepID=A0A1U7CWN0_9BACT|nr:PKD domain-containing protein [Paludisphaera borealis]APW63344.1 hypothetical protein BSF38_04908 [Paludisphaera borealis]